VLSAFKNLAFKLYVGCEVLPILTLQSTSQSGGVLTVVEFVATDTSGSVVQGVVQRLARGAA
jgi:hypothetical protein